MSCNKEYSNPVDGTCPFAFSEESEKVQGYGCLPNFFDIIKIRTNYGLTWACHDQPSKPCKGALLYMRKKGIDCRIINKEFLTIDDNWEKYV